MVVVFLCIYCAKIVHNKERFPARKCLTLHACAVVAKHFILIDDLHLQFFESISPKASVENSSAQWAIFLYHLWKYFVGETVVAEPEWSIRFGWELGLIPQDHGSPPAGFTLLCWPCDASWSITPTPQTSLLIHKPNRGGPLFVWGRVCGQLTWGNWCCPFFLFFIIVQINLFPQICFPIAKCQTFFKPYAFQSFFPQNGPCPLPPKKIKQPNNGPPLTSTETKDNMRCQSQCSLQGEGGGLLPYLEMVGNFRFIDPRFWHFPIPLGPFLCTARFYWLSLSAEKLVCLYHI